VGEEEGKTCVAGDCGDDFFIVLVAAAVEKMPPVEIRATAKVVGLDGLDKLRMRWVRWALKWYLFYCFPFYFLIFAVEMGWMGHYTASHLMFHLFFFFSFSFLALYYCIYFINM
jgi:hypothetical protein